MTGYRLARLEEAFKEEISDIVQKGLKDPRIGFITVTSVDISPDLRYAKVYLSILGKEAEKKDSLDGLESARGYIRQELGKRVRLKFTPELSFKIDTSIDEGFRISKIIGRIHESDEKK